MAVSNQVITVGCKLPHGLHMDIIREGRPRERVTLRGVNRAGVIGGFGITEVNEEFFNEWMRLNKDHPSVKQGFIFAHKQMKSIEDIARERQKDKTGLEGLDPDKPAPDIRPMKFDD